LADEALKTILDREGVHATVQEHFAPQLAALQGMVNYGTSLLVRAYNSSEKRLVDVVACGVLLKQAVMMLDGVELLVSSGAVPAASLPARAAFEASLYLEYVLAEDSEKRAAYYVVGSLRRDRWQAARVVGLASRKTDEFAAILDELGDEVRARRPVWALHAEEQLKEIDRTLSQPEFLEINQDFERNKVRGRYEIEWYRLLGERSLRGIAAKLRRRTEFELLYAAGTRIVHGVSYRDHISFVPGGFKFIPIRHLKDIRALLHASISLAFVTYRVIIRHYRPEEEERLRAKYIEEWRPAFISIKQVKYEF
jgi:3'-phosphoadenosine 5'-phosphosulfate sulfotransferase